MSVSSSYQQLALFAAVSTATAVATYLVARRLVEGSRRRVERDKEAGEEDSGLFELPRADPFDPRARSGYLSWDDYFMAVAFLSAQRSKDPNKQVGACIVSQEQIILGIGYNGFPRGCEDTKLPWAKRSRDNNKLDTKYPYVCHAEMNAILNKNTASLAGTTMYVTMFPCNECAKLLIQAGVAQVVFFEDKNRSSKGSPSKGGIMPEEAYLASRKLLSMAGIKLRQHKLRLPFTLSASAKQVID